MPATSTTYSVSAAAAVGVVGESVGAAAGAQLLARDRLEGTALVAGAEALGGEAGAVGPGVWKVVLAPVRAGAVPLGLDGRDGCIDPGIVWSASGQRHPSLSSHVRTGCEKEEDEAPGHFECQLEW